MKIVTHLDMVMLIKKVRSRDLATAVGVSEQNISVLKNGKAKGIRFSTLMAICKHLKCQPGDLFSFEEETAETN